MSDLKSLPTQISNDADEENAQQQRQKSCGTKPDAQTVLERAEKEWLQSKENAAKADVLSHELELCGKKTLHAMSAALYAKKVFQDLQNIRHVNKVIAKQPKLKLRLSIDARSFLRNIEEASGLCEAKLQQMKAAYSEHQRDKKNAHTTAAQNSKKRQALFLLD